MKDLNDIKAVYMIGIGGIGMSALARYFHGLGKSVSGYDRTATNLTAELQQAGIDVHYGNDVEHIPETFKNDDYRKQTLVIYTPAVPGGNAELRYFRDSGHRVMKRSEVLGELSRTYRTIAIAGTHGKTTTGSILAHLLRSSSMDCTAFLGGISSNYNTNLLTSANSELLVVEADEFDRSFLTLSPEIAVITSVDADHLDIYGSTEEMLGSFHDFTLRINENGTLIYRYGLPLNKISRRNLTYSLKERCDYYSTALTIDAGQYVFNLTGPGGLISDLRFGMPGIHNVENAIAAFAAADQLGLSETEVRNGLATYKGVKRRFDVHIRSDELVYIDDYAHHPTEIAACIHSVRELFPDRRVKGIFQPHLFSRTRDHMDGFAESLGLLDGLILLDIYPAREKPMEGITSAALLDRVALRSKQLLSMEQTIANISVENTDVLLTLGAGDIDQLVNPIINKLKIP